MNDTNLMNCKLGVTYCRIVINDTDYRLQTGLLTHGIFLNQVRERFCTHLFHNSGSVDFSTRHLRQIAIDAHHTGNSCFINAGKQDYILTS